MAARISAMPKVRTSSTIASRLSKVASMASTRRIAVSMENLLVDLHVGDEAVSHQLCQHCYGAVFVRMRGSN